MTGGRGRGKQRGGESIHTGFDWMAVSLVRGKRNIQVEEKALLIFLEERRERRTEISQAMEKKKEGQPEDRRMQDGRRERRGRSESTCRGIHLQGYFGASST